MSLFGRREVRFWKAKYHLMEGNYFSEQARVRELVDRLKESRLRVAQYRARADMWREKAEARLSKLEEQG